MKTYINKVKERIKKHPNVCALLTIQILDGITMKRS